jgi:osmoprotectant transport system permease protein
VGVLTRAWGWFAQSQQWHGPDGIPARLVEHLWYSGLALLLAAAIALPLGLLIGHTRRGAFVVVNLANAARALPTVGVLLLVVTFTGVGLLPVLIPLIALAVPPILVNTYEGVRGVDPDLADAAKGMGMTGPQVLLQVEAPVALPLILLGLRTAAVQIVATATIAAYVSLGGIGRFIFDGLARRDYDMVVGGAVLSVLLSLCALGIFTGAHRLFVSPGVRRRPRSQ